MRTALRTSIVTAALAGALLAPAATALAATAPQAATSVSAVTAVSASSSDKGRYDGEVVLVGKNRIAVLRNESEGPEVWIRAVGDNWKPADGWAGRVLAKLDLSNRRAVIEDTEYTLTDAGGYGLNVYRKGEGASDFYMLPKGTPATTPSTKPSTEPSAKPSAKPSAQPTAKTPATTSVKPVADVKAQTGAQTVVVPKGGVAAGAEFAAEDTDNSTTVAAGAGLVAIFAGLGVALLARGRRAARSRG
ncbi:hypothetical protein [Streptomyces sp. NBC_01006]|uniref:hypothetical protein n=1 Tax=Streptomyces sp. NBC_01006 TaxID=2903716 RepID=UPI00386923C8|nr:hypothetical protein OG509_23515 [Streptomyces sp. NBC_01006]